MIETVNLAILVGAGLIAASAFTSLISQRIGTPLLLVFLGIGLLAGEDGLLGISFDNGPLAYFVGSLALAIILFDSGFATEWRSYRLAAAPALVLATFGVVITAGLVGVAAHMFLGLGWIEAMILGSIVASTDAAAVFFLLRVGGITLRDRVRATLEIESGTNDPMSIFLTLTLVELARSGEGLSGAGLQFAWAFVGQIGLGILAGIVGGLAISALLNRLRPLDPGLFPIVALSMSLVLFAATGMIGGSGFVAAYICGLVAGNRRTRQAARIRRFQVGMTWLAQIGMFLTLGLLATPSQFGSVAIPAILLAVVLIFVARPVAVWLCLLPFQFNVREVTFISWVGLRGAVSILLAILPTLGGVSNGGVYFNVVFVMVLASLLVQGWTISRTAHALRLIVPTRSGLVDRIELELPGDADQELVGYRIHDDSPVVTGGRVPRWARPLLVVRGDRSYTIHNAGALQTGDQVYLFTSPRRIGSLDRVYAAAAPLGNPSLVGDFTLFPDAPLSQIAALYGAEVNEYDAATTAGEVLLRELNGPPEIGDRISLGTVDLIVRDLSEDGAITEVGLALEPARFPQLAQMGSWLRKITNHVAERRLRRGP